MNIDNYEIERERERKIREMKETTADITYEKYIKLLDELEDKNALLQTSIEEINRLNGIFVDEDILYLRINGLLNNDIEKVDLELGSLNEDFWYKLRVYKNEDGYTRIERYRIVDSLEENEAELIRKIGIRKEEITKVIDEERKLYLLIYLEREKF